MSVQVPDLMVYEYVHNGLTYAANNRTLDSLFASCIQRHIADSGKLWDQECERLVRSWCKLNEESYDVRYGLTEGVQPLSKILTCKKMIRVNAIQLHKYVSCIGYNIELSTIAKARIVMNQDKMDYDLLKKWQEDITSAIVTSMQEWKDAKWSDY